MKCKEAWEQDNPGGASVHLFVSDESPTKENVNDLYMIEPWEQEQYKPQQFNYAKVEFSLPRPGHEITAYGYFIRDNVTGQIIFSERFNGAPLVLEAKYGGTIEVDLTNIAYN